MNFQLTNGAPPGIFVGANTYNGWFIGSGFEYSFDRIPGLFVKTEYRYSTYTAANLPILFTSSGAPSGFALQSTQFTQTISTELVWRFNWFGR